MAFPTVTASTSASATSGAFTVPAFSPGDLLLLTCCFGTNPSGCSSTNGAYLELGAIQVGSTTFNKVYGKVAQASDTCVVAGGLTGAGQMYSIANWSGTLTDIGYASTTAAVNPPSLNMGAVRDHLWIAGGSNFTNNITAAPASYTGLVVSTYASGSNSKVASAVRSLNAQTEDPGAFTATANFPGGWTIGIPPVTPGGPPLGQWRRRRNSGLLVR